jgi:hypothetical protein
MMGIAFVLVMVFGGLTNEHGSQVGKDEGLDKGYQHLNYVNEYGKGNGDGRKADTRKAAHVTKYEDQ